MALAGKVTLLLCVAVLASGFWRNIHESIIDEAFNATSGADQILDRQTVKNSSFSVDVNNQTEDQQYMHSMRPAGMSLATAQQRAADYIRDERAAALADVHAHREKSASVHVGRVLHAIQDRKHNWTSCRAASNAKDSADSCNSSRTGCAPAETGLGNHGLVVQGCLIPGPGYNFQAATDKKPGSLYDPALAESVAFLKAFVAEAKP